MSNYSRFGKLIKPQKAINRCGTVYVVCNLRFLISAPFYCTVVLCLLYILQFKRNRLSKFEYYEGDPDATRASEEVLLQGAQRPKFFHNGGWLGFKPSDYNIEVSFFNRWLI